MVVSGAAPLPITSTPITGVLAVFEWRRRAVMTLISAGTRGMGTRPQPPRLTRWEKLTLAVLTAKLARSSAGPRARLDHLLLLFKPETVLKWHRELSRRKWTFRRQRSGGRPATPAEVEALILRLARDNAGWGYSRIHGRSLGGLGPGRHVSTLSGAQPPPPWGGGTDRDALYDPLYDP